MRAFEAGAAAVGWWPAPVVLAEQELVVVQVRHLGEIVGDVAVQPSADRPLSTQDRRLLAGVGTTIAGRLPIAPAAAVAQP